jgi:hypothetical protein
MCPANSRTLILASSGLASIGKAAEGAGLADRALRLDPRMTPANLTGVHDAYFMAQQYASTRQRVRDQAGRRWALEYAEYPEAKAMGEFKLSG